MSAGYSGTPLAKKLGYKSGVTVALVDAPLFMRDVVSESGATARSVKAAKDVKGPIEAIHLFAIEERVLKSALPVMMKTIQPDGMIWVSWPKKASKVETDITEDVIRKHALPLGLVDVKVCAVDEVWSGLKLMIRKSNRS